MATAVELPGHNWAGNHSYRATALHRPASLPELQELVAGSSRLHVLGSRHSFNGIADSTGELVCLDGIDPDFALAADRRSVTVGGGARYGDVAQYLHSHGLALRNLASLPHISVAGAISTGTHGSGNGNQCLAAGVLALDVVLPSGEVRHCSPQTIGADFGGVVVSFGALGVITRVTLAVVPSFDVRQDVYETLPWPAFDEHFDELTALAYSVSMFTDFRDGLTTVWLKSTGEATPPSDVFGARPAITALHPIPGLDSVNTTAQLGEPGPSHDRLPHFRIGFTPSNGAEIQSEYLVDRRNAVPAVRAVRALADRLAPLLQVAEIRTVAADDLWLSPCSGRDTVALHFTWVRRQPAVEALLAELEAALVPFDARPHWGKLFVTPPQRLRERYPSLPRFRALRDSWDPDGKFGNPFTDYVLGTDPTG